MRMEEEYSAEVNKKSRGGGGGSRFNRRSEAIASGSTYMLLLILMIPEIPRDDFEFVFNKLDVTCDSKEVMGSSRGNKLWQKCKINLDEFARLCNVIALKFEEKDSMSIVEKFPKFYHSPASKKLRDFIRSPTFEYIIVFILLVNFVAVIVETMLDVQNNSAQIFWQKAENIFVTEEITTLVGPHGLTFMSNGNWIRYLLIGRMLRFIRLLMHIERFHAFVTTFFTLIHCLLPYLGTIFCILCIYCSLGLQIFGGIVNMGNPKLHQTDLAGYEFPFVSCEFLAESLQVILLDKQRGGNAFLVP